MFKFAERPIILMKYIFTLGIVLLSFIAGAQYYYKDIIGTSETNAMMKLYKANRVAKVSITGYDADGNRTEDFFGVQVLTGNGELHTATRSNETDETRLVSVFDNESRLVKTYDSTGSMFSTSTYVYDEAGRLKSITSISSDTGNAINTTEIHNWFYNAAGKAEKMTRMVNGTTNLEVQFVYDADGNLAEEKPLKNGVAQESVYYYYDDNNRLTDIARFNRRARRVLPDYIFYYGAKGELIQKLTVPANSSNYMIWRYQYDQRGLKIREVAYTKDKEVTGKIEYAYVFN